MFTHCHNGQVVVCVKAMKLKERAIDGIAGQANLGVRPTIPGPDITRNFAQKKKKTIHGKPKCERQYPR